MRKILRDVPVLVTGSTGKLGILLRKAWSLAPPDGFIPVFQGRETGEIRWRMLEEPYNGPALKGGIVINFAGVTRGSPEALQQNVTLAQVACETARQQEAAHVFLLSSAAVYGSGKGASFGESAECEPLSAYGEAKLAMERAVQGQSNVTILRLGNVVGADALIAGNTGGGTVVLDPSPTGIGGPERSYIGPVSLGSVLLQLCQLAMTLPNLPAVLNVAAPDVVGMAEVLTAAQMDWRFGPPNPAMLPKIELDVARLQAILPLPMQTADAQSMVNEWRSLHEVRI